MSICYVLLFVGPPLEVGVIVLLYYHILSIEKEFASDQCDLVCLMWHERQGEPPEPKG